MSRTRRRKPPLTPALSPDGGEGGEADLGIGSTPHPQSLSPFEAEREGVPRRAPSEFKQFIGKGMKMSQVEYASKPDAASILTFYMGKNTPERKDYIMGNLVVAVEA